MFTRFQTWLKGLPGRWIVCGLGVAIWSIAWGVAAATIYCHWRLGHYATMTYVIDYVKAFNAYEKVAGKTDSLEAKRLLLSDEKGDMVAWLNVDGFAFTKGKSGVLMSFDANGNPSLTLTDSTGNDRLVLGSTQTTIVKTGETRTAPVSSITLFGKDGTVIKQIE